METMSKHVGKVAYEQENVIYFKEGIPGFETEKEFIIILSSDLNLPFHYLQSINQQNVAFVITDPFLFVDDYDFDVPEEVVTKLEIDSLSDLSVYCITIIPDNIEATSINLAAPLIINHKSKLGKQLILPDHQSKIKYSIFNRERKGEAYADSNT